VKELKKDIKHFEENLMGFGTIMCKQPKLSSGTEDKTEGPKTKKIKIDDHGCAQKDDEVNRKIIDVSAARQDEIRMCEINNLEIARLLVAAGHHGTTAYT
jgi:hypothetical protein